MQHTQDMPWAALGGQLRRLRVARGLTQAALAERAGVSRIYVQKLELEAERAPSLPTLGRLARALGVRLSVAFVARRTEARRGR